MENYFTRLNSINVTEHIEKKSSFAYLSWPYAVAQLRQAEPSASWEVRRFEGLPYQKTELGYFVEVAVTVQGITLSQIHPVLDADNQPIEHPTVFDINTSIQRCLVKAIALHGLGLYVYAGEDLPVAGQQRQLPAAKSEQKVAAHHAAAGAKPVTPAQLRYIGILLKETGVQQQALLNELGVFALEDLTSQLASAMIRSLEGRKKAA